MMSPHWPERRTLQTFSSKAPCRVCLFGEHQDYLGFPVIAASIPIFVEIQGTLWSGSGSGSSSSLTADNKIAFNYSSRIIELTIPALSDLPRVYDLDNLTDYRHQQSPQVLLEDGRPLFAAPVDETTTTPPPDFALSVLQECHNVEGWTILQPGQLLQLTSTVTNDLPMQAGCSTSSAFIVALIRLLAVLSGGHEENEELLTNDNDDDKDSTRSHHLLRVAQLAFRPEVTHFGAPGGTMDHITCSVGGLVRIGPDPWRYEHLLLSNNNNNNNNHHQSSSYAPAVLILADSGEPKETWKHLYRCKQRRVDLLHGKLGGDWDNPSRNSTNSILTLDERALLEATLTNRETEQAARRILQELNHCRAEHHEDDVRALQLWQQVGTLMNRHHAALRDGLHLSTDRLEAMRTAALQAGAWGYKVVGSGGGGCGVAVGPAAHAESIRRALIQQGGARTVWIIPAPGPTATLTVHDMDVVLCAVSLAV